MTFDPKALLGWCQENLGIQNAQELSFELRINPSVVNKFIKGERPDFGVARALLKRGCPPELLPSLPMHKPILGCVNCPHNPANADVLQAMSDVKPAKTAKPKLAPKAA
ncbi:hypothetical protein [Megalodesulfovibrio gigas]|uniref:hypothetical protein n=1 Tax=Megalodesulfovibrio gigas TaxID=879 RepID=UPI00041C5C8A|nr:hypothetical protein [Megalodesulfovibrio gigas]